MQRSGLTADSVSFVTPYGYQSGSCGYCKDPETSGSYYAGSKRLTVDHYQALIDRSWRRIPASQFTPSRDQRQTINRWNRFVLGDEYIKESAKLHPKSKAQKKQRKNEFDLVTSVHESEYSYLKTPPQPEHRFEVNLEPSTFTDEKYALFEQYQRLIHKEPPSSISKVGFKRFLYFGSRHQCYRLDGKLIALAVLDLLPRAVSAVYFIYDIAFEKYSFGKLSALREAALALEGGYGFYNMGYYIHSCVKMRYKCDYKPQYVLDPDNYQWDALDDEVKAKLDARKFVSLSRDRKGVPSSPADGLDDGNDMQGEHFTSPSEAVDSGESMLTFGIPGLMSVDEVENAMIIDPPLIALGQGSLKVVPATALVRWDESSLVESQSIKCAVGELVAAVGADVAGEMIVDFSSE